MDHARLQQVLILTSKIRCASDMIFEGVKTSMSLSKWSRKSYAEENQRKSSSNISAIVGRVYSSDNEKVPSVLPTAGTPFTNRLSKVNRQYIRVGLRIPRKLSAIGVVVSTAFATESLFNAFLLIQVMVHRTWLLPMARSFVSSTRASACCWQCCSNRSYIEDWCPFSFDWFFGSVFIHESLPLGLNAVATCSRSYWSPLQSQSAS